MKPYYDKVKWPIRGYELAEYIKKANEPEALTCPPAPNMGTFDGAGASGDWSDTQPPELAPESFAGQTFITEAIRDQIIHSVLEAEEKAPHGGKH